jgi:hypothetical protein
MYLISIYYLPNDRIIYSRYVPNVIGSDVVGVGSMMLDNVGIQDKKDDSLGIRKNQATGCS